MLHSIECIVAIKKIYRYFLFVRICGLGTISLCSQKIIYEEIKSIFMDSSYILDLYGNIGMHKKESSFLLRVNLLHALDSIQNEPDSQLHHRKEFLLNPEPKKKEVMQSPSHLKANVHLNATRVQRV